MRLIFFVFALLLGINAAHPQSLEEVDHRQAALIEAWQKTPLTIRRALFLKGEPRGFGLYDEHPSNEFKKGEKIIAYAEPVGYGWKETGNGLFELGFVVDFLIKAKDGEILAGKENFMRIATESHTQPRIHGRVDAEHEQRTGRRLCRPVQIARHRERQDGHLRDAVQDRLVSGLSGLPALL